MEARDQPNRRGIRLSQWRGRGIAWGLVLALRLGAAEVTPSREGVEFFESKIRPVLVERCHKCHSVASEKVKGGLRVDSREALLAGGDTRPAIVPGDPEKSLLIEALRYENNDLQMPPKKKLGEAEVANFAEWIKMGAPWPGGSVSTKVAKAGEFDLKSRREQHWSWKPIQAAPPPEVKDAKWPKSVVDRFLLAKLEKSALQPAPEADRRTLIRRATFDLTGLPPTPAEVDAFLKDGAPDAFEKVVDRLLASPHFGERWARHWLDLARYGETLGHEFDYANWNAWRYRDYVIRAFNSDLAYNQFVVEQVAGDLLETPRRHPTEGFNESMIGPGFYWLGQRSHSPVDVRLEQGEVFGNQIDVVTKTFMALTVACARCHDHKFDAISARDYYSLYGVLGSSRYAQRSIDPPDQFRRHPESLAKKKSALRPLIGQVWRAEAGKVEAYLQGAREIALGDASVALSNRIQTVATGRQIEPARLERWSKALDKEKNLAPDHPLYAWSKLGLVRGGGDADAFGKARQILVEELGRGQAGATAAAKVPAFVEFSGRDFAGWTLEDEAFGGSPAGAGDFVVGDPQRPVAALLRTPTANSGAVARKLEGVLRSPTFTITNHYVHVLVAGKESRLNLRVDNFTMTRDPIYGGLKRHLNQDALQWITIDVETWKGHRAYLEFNDLPVADPSDEPDKRFSELAWVAVSQVVFSEDSKPPTEIGRGTIPALEQLATTSSIAALAQAYQDAALAAVRAWSDGGALETLPSAQLAWLEWLNWNGLLDGKAGEAATRELETALVEFRKLEDAVPGHTRALGMIEGDGLDEVVFIRGNHRTPGEVVPRRFLEALGGAEQTRFTQGSGRLELARAMTDPKNPFPARVMVNRVWQHLFGRGIVPTPDDFGVLGQAPSHPELLDWLADWYRGEGGWSNKRLIRLLVTSRAYQMSSRPADAVAEENDPQNILLHRMQIRRLEGESIRDAILAVSGRLDTTMFGPPVPVFLTQYMEGRGRPSRSGPMDGAGRRSLYQEVRRNFLPQMMRAFDFPVPFTTIGQRTASNVPAQSLILMNDPFVLEQAKLWAKAVLAKEGSSAEERIRGMYETAYSRPPEAAELAEAMAFLDRQSEAYGLTAAQRASDPALWADLGHVLFNVKSFVFVN